MGNIEVDDNFINLRISNTLAKFDKKVMIKLKENQDAVRLYLLDGDCGKYAALLMDGQIKAASDEYIISEEKESQSMLEKAFEGIGYGIK